MDQTVSLELTADELYDIRVALMEYRSKWFDLYHKGIAGEMPENFSVVGAGLVYDGIVKLQKRLSNLHDFSF